MEAPCFKLIRERKRVKRWDWERVADEINHRNGTDLNGEQIKEFVQRGVVPFGGWLTKALEDVMDIPDREPKTWISFKGGGSNE